MKTSIPKIKRIKFKDGRELTVFPFKNGNLSRVDLGWGEVTFRAYDAKPLVARDLTYMCDAAKYLIINED